MRELRNLVQRLHPVSRHRDIALSDLPPEITVERAGGGAADRGAGACRSGFATPRSSRCCKAIAEHNGNLTRVAEALGITRPTLYRKLKLYNIERTYR